MPRGPVEFASWSGGSSVVLPDDANHLCWALEGRKVACAGHCDGFGIREPAGNVFPLRRTRPIVLGIGQRDGHIHSRIAASCVDEPVEATHYGSVHPRVAG